ncbi:dephospho-CoA kinase [methane-oxidizing endosymbiont of Gigantopelta aegis]|uniref:dephospho-CoA kinase n=1 Tax=methane-oxidizing endosymbiont of Gigantopelta aegis TaxID=2794938 RepID=UPI0018DC6DDA|nr:dephospho-CoA kinase [methane-oxidizing endosymbiont of Gigantopelta aegis]
MPQAFNPPLKIGLTGGIGSGKSTVCKLFSAFSIPIIDADIIAREIVAPGQAALAQIQLTFGNILLADGTLDRKKLGQIIFADPAKKQCLENILHPLIYQRLKTQAAAQLSPYVILAIPLLFETDMTDLVDRILVIDCPETLQLQRVKQRDQLDDDQIQRIIASQSSREERLGRADDIIDNSKSTAELAEQVKNLHNLYLSLI